MDKLRICYIPKMILLVLSLFICVIKNNVDAVSYGPSLVSLTKYNKQIHGPTLFHPETGRALHLEDYPNYSVTVPLAPDSPTATSNQVFISRRISGPGEFIVQAPKGHGVMAVIQSMDFRPANTGCNDFIQFGELDGGVETTGTCGKVDNRDGSFAPSELLGPRVFFSPSGSMRVLFYHGYIWGLVRDFNFDLLDPSRNPVLRLEVTFTAYKDCNVENSTQSGYTACSSWSGSNSRTCISSNLFCDRILNCGFQEEFGSDEDDFNCHPHLFNLLAPIPSPPGSEYQYQTTPVTTTTKLTTTTIRTKPTTTTTEATTTTTEKATTATTTTEKTTTATTTTEKITTTTTPKPITTVPTAIETTTEIAFTKRLRQFVFDVSSSTTKIPSTISTEESKNVILETVKPSNSNKESLNMTFSEDNELSVDAQEARLELIPENSSTEDNLDDETASSLIIALACLLAVLIILAVCLRIYCHYHTIIWIPNPKSLRRMRKKQESPVSESETGIPEIHGSPQKIRKETPPSYDILFPKPGEKCEV